MAHRPRFNVKKHLQSRPRLAAPEPASYSPPYAPKNFGAAFILLEDRAKNTFVYEGNNWAPYALSIAECRQKLFQVKELSQKVGDKSRYEVREPLE